MDKFAEQKKFSSRKFNVTVSVAMCLLGAIGGGEIYAAPMPQVVATSKALTTVSGNAKASTSGTGNRYGSHAFSFSPNHHITL